MPSAPELALDALFDFDKIVIAPSPSRPFLWDPTVRVLGICHGPLRPACYFGSGFPGARTPARRTQHTNEPSPTDSPTRTHTHRAWAIEGDAHRNCALLPRLALDSLGCIAAHAALVLLHVGTVQPRGFHVGGRVNVRVCQQ